MTRHAAVGAAFANAPLALDLARVTSVPAHPFSGFLPFDPTRQPETPAEQFRTLRTRLGQMQSERALQMILVTSPSAGEGKSFIAANLAWAESQLADNPTVLCDFDLRNPAIHSAFGMERAPGIGDHLLGQVNLDQALRRIGDSNLYVLPAGRAIPSPLELLHLKEVGRLLDCLRAVFSSIILDSPPLLSASDANLLAPEADGTLLVAKIGATGAQSMHQAIESIGLSNILGIVANGVA